MTQRHRICLGPQMHRPILQDVMDELNLGGEVALITAGWQERELEDDEARDALRLPVHNLELHARSDRVFKAHQDLFEGHRRKQDACKRLQGIYRQRLKAELELARRYWHKALSDDLLAPELQHLIGTIRELDQHHASRLAEIQSDFESEYNLSKYDVVCQEREGIASQLQQCDTIAIAGGHVAVILNRLRLFNLAPMLEEKHIIAWSAGAMALTDRIVSFHDTPPQGESNPEVFELGLGIFQELCIFPHASERLILDDERRLGLIARRFMPSISVALEFESRLDAIDGGWQLSGSTRLIQADGSLSELGGAS